MELKWKKTNIINDLLELNSRFYKETSIDKKTMIAFSINQYITSYNLTDYEKLGIKLKNINFYKKQYDKYCNNLLEKFCHFIEEKNNDFDSLINNIYKIGINFDFSGSDNKNGYIIDTKSIDYINYFTKIYDAKLNKYFEFLINNGYINFKNEDNNETFGICYQSVANRKNYIQINYLKNNMVAPTLVHELGHAYHKINIDSLYFKLYNYSFYNEVFPNFLELVFSKFLQNSNYYEQGEYSISNIISTIICECIDLKEMFDKNEEDNIYFSDFVSMYGANIALAYFYQYQSNKKEAKQNISYFLQNSDIIFSDELLRETGIDLKKLYNGYYFKDFCEKNKTLIKLI